MESTVELQLVKPVESTGEWCSIPREFWEDIDRAVRFRGVGGFAVHDTSAPAGSGDWLRGDGGSGGGLVLGVFFGRGAGLDCRSCFGSFGNRTIGDAVRLLYQNHK